MEIQKIFSSYDGYEEERLYSILMSEEELVLFSELQKEFSGTNKIAQEIVKGWEKSGKTGTGFEGALNRFKRARGVKKGVQKIERRTKEQMEGINKMFENNPELKERYGEKVKDAATNRVLLTSSLRQHLGKGGNGLNSWNNSVEWVRGIPKVNNVSKEAINKSIERSGLKNQLDVNKIVGK